jgi:hypothetical protein
MLGDLLMGAIDVTSAHQSEPRGGSERRDQLPCVVDGG